MRITIYELLGLVKDEKAPKIIKYDGDIYEYGKTQDDYMIPGAYSSNGFLDNLSVFSQLNDTVKILEEENKINYIDEYSSDLEENYFILKNKITELIDEINKLKEKQ